MDKTGGSLIHNPMNKRICAFHQRPRRRCLLTHPDYDDAALRRTQNRKTVAQAVERKVLYHILIILDSRQDVKLYPKQIPIQTGHIPTLNFQKDLTTSRKGAIILMRLRNPTHKEAQMKTYSKRYLESLDVRFDRVPNLNEVEVSWKERGYRQALRVCAMNSDKFCIARPGLGGTFRLSYDWVFQTLPLVGTGPKTIKAHLLDSRHTCYRYTHHGDELMTNLLTSMLDVARKMLLKEVAQHERKSR